jgi:transcriptional regulator with XRE-family HTH domain
MKEKIIVKYKKMTLSELRKHLKMSQPALGMALGVSRSAIAQWELGIREMTLNVSQIQTLTHLLNKIGKDFNDLETNPMNRNKKPLSYGDIN